MNYLLEKLITNPQTPLFKIGRNLLVIGICTLFLSNAALTWVENYLEPQIETITVTSSPSSEQTKREKNNLSTPPDTQAIVQRNIFGGKAKKSEKEDEKEISLEDIPLAQNIKDLKLIGTVVSSYQKDWAIIKDSSKNEEQIYNTGDKIKNARIKNILRNNVIINRGDQDEVLSIDYKTRDMLKNKMGKEGGSTAGKKYSDSQPDDTVTLDKDYVKNTLSDVKQVFKQAQIMPYTENGKTKGFKLTNIKENSLFDKLGIKDGDVVVSADNIEINNPQQIQELARKLSNKDSIDLQLKRDNKKINKRYRLK